MVLSAEQETGSGDAGVSRTATTLILLQTISNRILFSAEMKEIMDWRGRDFVVAEIDQRQRKRTEWNIRVRVDRATEEGKKLWAPKYKELILPQCQQILKCEMVFVYVRGADIPGNRFLDGIDMTTKDARPSTATGFKRLTDPKLLTEMMPDSLPTATQTATITTDADKELDLLLGKYGQAFDPVDKKRICSAMTTRCPNCDCLNNP